MALIGRLSIGLILAGLGSVFAAAQSGTGYTLQLDSSATPFPITSIDYGTQNNVTNGSQAGRSQLSPIVVTFSAGGPQVPALLGDCFTNKALSMVVAKYSVNGTPQLDVQFRSVRISSIQFPSVTTAGAPGDITVTLLAQAEATTEPSSGTTPPGVKSNLVLHREGRPALVQRWTLPQRLPMPVSGGNFTFTMTNVDTSGVQAVNSLKFVAPTDAATGLAAGKLQMPPILLTVSLAKLASFTALQGSRHVANFANLILNRPAAAGGGSSVQIRFKNVLVLSVNVSGQSGSAPVATVQLSYETAEVVNS